MKQHSIKDELLQKLLEPVKSIDFSKDKLSPLDTLTVTHFFLGIIQKDPGMNKKELINIILVLANDKRTYGTIAKYYNRAVKMLESEIRASLPKIRAQRLMGLEIDLKTAYTEYLESESSMDRNRWFATYISLKLQIDRYFPNDLRMLSLETPSEDNAIQISYIKALPAPEEKQLNPENIIELKEVGDGDK